MILRVPQDELHRQWMFPLFEIVNLEEQRDKSKPSSRGAAARKRRPPLPQNEGDHLPKYSKEHKNNLIADLRKQAGISGTREKSAPIVRKKKAADDGDAAPKKRTRKKVVEEPINTVKRRRKSAK